MSRHVLSPFSAFVEPRADANHDHGYILLKYPVPELEVRKIVSQDQGGCTREPGSNLLGPGSIELAQYPGLPQGIEDPGIRAWILTGEEILSGIS